MGSNRRLSIGPSWRAMLLRIKLMSKELVWASFMVPDGCSVDRTQQPYQHVPSFQGMAIPEATFYTLVEDITEASGAECQGTTCYNTQASDFPDLVSEKPHLESSFPL